MKKIVFVSIAIFLLGAKLLAQQHFAGENYALKAPTKASLVGRVLDDKGNALAGAAIFVHDIKTGAIAANDGSYAILKIQAGKYLVEVSYLGFGSIIETIDIVGDVKRDFVLSQKVTEQEAVTVTGNASATRVKQSAQPVTIVKHLDLLKTSSTNLIDALSKTVPGLSALSTGPAISKPIIRGLGYNRMVLVNDGVRQEGQQWGDEHGIEIDAASVQRAEVLKGPASLMYGSDAMAGVVNILTNVPVEQGSIKGNIATEYMSNNNLYGFNGNVAGHLKNGFNWNVYGTYKNAADYKNKLDGRVYNSRFNEANVGGYIGINKHWGYAHVLVSSFNQQVGLIEGERDSATGKFLVFAGTPAEHIATDAELTARAMVTPYQKINHFKVTSDNSFILNNGNRLTLTIAYQRNQRREFGDYTAPTTPNLYFDLNTINYNLQYHFAEKKGWKTSIGINGMQQTNKNKATNVLIPEYSLFDAGAFVYIKKSINPKTTLSGGIRYDYRNVNSKLLSQSGVTKFAPFTKNFGNVSGSIGISHEASKTVTLKANVARGYRAPSIAELASNGAHEGTNRYEYGDNNLKTETSLQADAGIDINTEHVSFGANVFYNNINNYIYYSRLANKLGGDSLVNVNGNFIDAFKFRQASAALYGFELKFDIHPHPLDWLHFENSVAFVRGNFNQKIEGNDNLPFIPAPSFKSELRGDFKKLGNSFANLYVKLEMLATTKQTHVFTAYDTETPTDDYTLFNAGFGTDVTAKKKTLFSLYVAYNNIGNVSYQNHLSRLKYAAYNYANGRNGVYNMGSNLSLKVNVPLGR